MLPLVPVFQNSPLINLDRKQYVLVPPNYINLFRLFNRYLAQDFHLFEVNINGFIQISCCGRFQIPLRLITPSDLVLYADSMRMHIAPQGRSICGQCAAHLYGNND